MELTYVFAVLVLACGGIPKGYDEGGFSSSMKLASFITDYDLDDESPRWVNNQVALANRTANIASFGVLGAAFGTLLSLFLSDRYGRLRCWRGFAILWATGLFVQIFASGILGVILFGRIWQGLGAGGLTVISPMFLSEIATVRKRGTTVGIFMVVLLSFLSIGFFISYGAGEGMAPTRMQYRLVQAIPLIPVGAAFFGTFFIKESPRWLAARDRSEEAMDALAFYRGASINSAEVAVEVEEIRDQLSAQSQSLKGVSIGTRVKEIIHVPTYRKRMVLALTMQTVAQWSGGNGITYYIPTIFEDAGIGSTGTALIASGAYGIVKLVFTMVFTWGLVDYFGRRPSFIAGLSLQLVGHLYLLFFNAFASKTSDATTSIAILAVFVYAVGWSIGLCTVQYLYGTEIFPTRIRAVCYASNMALHWFFQFAVVRVIPTMMTALHTWGGFLFFASVCTVGLVLLFLMAPETNRIPMEQMDELFSGPWYTLGRAKVSPHRPDLLDEEKSKASANFREVGDMTPPTDQKNSYFKST